METEDKQSPKSKLTLFVFVGVIIGLGAIVAFFVWLHLSIKTPTDVIIVKAVDGPIKVKPLDPSGTTVPHQGLLVIDMLKNGAANSVEVETLRSDGSLPEPPPIAVGNSENTSTYEKVQKVVKDRVTSATEVAKTETANQLENPKKTNEKIIVKQKDEPVFVIQLAAFRSAKKAEEIANLLSSKHGSRLSGLRLQTKRLDTGSNGIFFRVVSPPLPRANAEVACVNLRRAGQDCFVRKVTALER